MQSNYEVLEKPLHESDSNSGIAEGDKQPVQQIEIDQNLAFQPNAINSPTTQGLQQEELPDVDLESNDLTAGLDKTSVSNSDKVNQRLSQSKEEGSDDILLEQEPGTNQKSAEGPDEHQTLQKTPFDFSNRRVS